MIWFDPLYMVMLMKLLGPGYEVWDKSASIRVRRPGCGTLRAVCRIEDAQLALIQALVDLDQSEAVPLLDQWIEDGTLQRQVREEARIARFKLT